MKKFQQVIFITIILIFALSSVLAYSSTLFKTSSTAPADKAIVSPEEKQKIADDKIAQSLGQGMEGVVKQFGAEEAKTKEATYYLDVDGVTLAFLEPDPDVPGIELGGYVDKNVKVWGDFTQTIQTQEPVMKVKKIQLR